MSALRDESMWCRAARYGVEVPPELLVPCPDQSEVAAHVGVAVSLDEVLQGRLRDVPASALDGISDADLLEAVRAVGPQFLSPSGVARPFSSAELVEVMGDVGHVAQVMVARRLVWPSVARWVRTGSPDDFDVRAVAESVVGDGSFARAWVPPVFSAAVDVEFGVLTVLDAAITQRMLATCDAFSSPVDFQLPPPDDEARMLLARSGRSDVVDVALDRHDRVADPVVAEVCDAVCRAAHRGVTEPLRAVLGEMDHNSLLYEALDSARRCALVSAVLAVVERGDPDDQLELPSQLFVSDPHVALPLRARLLSWYPSIDLSPGTVETWCALAAVPRPEGVDAFSALRSVFSHGSLRHLATRFGDVTASALVELLRGCDAGDVSALETFARVSDDCAELVRSVPLPLSAADRVLAAVWVPGFAEQWCGVGPGARRWYTVPPTPSEAASVVVELRRLGGDEEHLLDVLASFAAVLDSDPRTRPLLDSVDGLVAAMCTWRDRNDVVAAVLARRLDGHPPEAWRFVSEMAPTWRTTVSDLVDCAVAATAG